MSDLHKAVVALSRNGTKSMQYGARDVSKDPSWRNVEVCRCAHMQITGIIKCFPGHFAQLEINTADGCR